MVVKSTFVRECIWKEYVLFVNISSIQEPFPCKHILLFMRFIEFWLPRKFNVTGFVGSTLKSQKTMFITIHAWVKIQQITENSKKILTVFCRWFVDTYKQSLFFSEVDFERYWISSDNLNLDKSFDSNAYLT